MNTTNVILYLVVNAFHIYLFFLAYRIFFGHSKFTRHQELLGFLSFYLVNSMAFLAAGNPFLNLATSIIPLVMLTFLYPGKTRTKLLICIFACGISMLLESLSLSVLNLLGIDFAVQESIIVNMMANMVIFSLELVYKNARQDNDKKVLKLEYWLAILVLPIGSIIITALVYCGEYSVISNLVIVVILITMNVLAFHLYELLEKYYFSNYERSLLQQQNAAYAHEFELIRKADETSRLIRHDFKNHIAVIKQLLQSRKLETLEAYLSDFGDFTVKGEYVSSGNAEIDSILNYKLSGAESIGAEITVEVRIPTSLTIEPLDISVILGNLLDNATEAMDKSQVKRLGIQVYVDRGAFFIQISNTYSGIVKKVPSGGIIAYITQKEHPEMHGIGLTNVYRTVEKYDGKISIDDTGQQFVVEVMLYLP